MVQAVLLLYLRGSLARVSLAVPMMRLIIMMMMMMMIMIMIMIMMLLMIIMIVILMMLPRPDLQTAVKFSTQPLYKHRMSVNLASSANGCALAAGSKGGQWHRANS